MTSSGVGGATLPRRYTARSPRLRSRVSARARFLACTSTRTLSRSRPRTPGSSGRGSVRATTTLPLGSRTNPEDMTMPPVDFENFDGRHLNTSGGVPARGTPPNAV